MSLSLDTQLEHCLTADRYQFWKRLKNLGPDPETEVYQKLLADIKCSIEKVKQKQHGRPKLSYDMVLPVCQKRAEILQAIQQNQVVVIAGETGSGKTTQLPKMCLELGFGCRGYIGHTQPRRIAARSVAMRIAEELNVTFGMEVGYKIRFQDKVNSQTYIKVMTDGILLAEAHHDRFLSQYEVLIVDEAHERSLNIDFILGYIKKILPKRPELKIIITSATIDPERFSKYFNNAPILEVSGRTYPVEIRYRPLVNEEDEKTLYEGIVEAVDECYREGPGDILVFLSGEREIREGTEILCKQNWQQVKILPLYARLSAKDQHRIFETHIGSKIILTTNVAETSLTVPGIRYVIDAGKARVSRYSYRSQIQRLPIEAISKASAKQRSGRCGRVMAGICIRLYSEEDYVNRHDFTEPEIMRTNLAAVILQMLALGLGHIEHFPFIEAPDPRYIRDGLRLLMQLGAIDEYYKITNLGYKIAKLPIDPRLAVMLQRASQLACLDEVLVITSFLSIPDPREWPLDSKPQSQALHARFNDKTSDFITILNLWKYLQEKKQQLSKNKFQKMCLNEYLSSVRVRDWFDIYQQLLSLTKESGMRIGENPAPHHLVHQALLTGLVMNIGMLTEMQDYKGIKAKNFKIFPGSVVKKKPKWLMAFEIFETQQVYARMVAAIDVLWIEQVAKSLLKKQYSEPHWDERREQVIAYERANFYGLPIYHGRKVQYTRINPQEAREIMIKEGLVQGLVKEKPAFLLDNLSLVEDIEVLENKSRRRDILVDSDQLYQFYHQHIPGDIIDYHTLKKWLKKQPENILSFSKSSLMCHEAENITDKLYPEILEEQGYSLRLSYCFEPSEEDDGVTVYIPALVFPELNPSRFEWLAPGMIEEKIIALIKTLPKQIRVHFIPAPEFAKVALARMNYGHGHLLEQLALVLASVTGVKINQSHWKEEELPKHLRMMYALIDENCEIVTKSRNWQDLISHTKGIVKNALNQNLIAEAWPQHGITAWSFGVLPESIIVERHGIHIKAYPRLQDKKNSVSVELFTDPVEARFHHHRGLVRLIYLIENKTIKYLKKNMPHQQQLQLLFSSFAGLEQLQAMLLLVSIDVTFLEGDEFFSEHAFSQALQSRREYWVGNFTKIAQIFYKVLTLAQKIKIELDTSKTPHALQASYDACIKHLSQLVHAKCLFDIQLQWIQRLPVYLQGILLRIERIRQAPLKDQQLQKQLTPFIRLYQQHQEDYFYLSQPAYIHFRWLIEEYTLSLFAQQLKTIEKVSSKRLEKAWASIVHRNQ